MNVLDVSEVRSRISEMVDGALHRGETTIIRRHGRQVCALVPLSMVKRRSRTSGRKRGAGSASGAGG